MKREALARGGGAGGGEDEGIGLGFVGFVLKFPARSVSLLVSEMFWCGGLL